MPVKNSSEASAETISFKADVSCFSMVVINFSHTFMSESSEAEKAFFDDGNEKAT